MECNGRRTCTRHNWCHGPSGCKPRSECGDKCCYVDEPSREHKCSHDRECDGERTCSQFGWCQGESGCRGKNRLCADWCCGVDETKNQHRCSEHFECNGARYCHTGSGFCQGKSRC